MKKIFVSFAAMTALVLVGCNQPTDDPNGGTTPAGAATFTIKNESSYDLSDVKWSGVSFASPDSSDLLKGTASKKEVMEVAQGYLTFTRKDNGINLRASLLTIDDSPFTILNTTLVFEVGNESNSGTLSGIGLLPEIGIEYNDNIVVKNDTVSTIETIAAIPKQTVFTLKNTGSGVLTLTGAAPVSVSGSAEIFSVTQPAGSIIAPAGSLPFTITFTPQAVDTYTTTVTVKSNTPSGDFTFTITANGTEPKPIITILNGTSEVLQNGTVDMGNVTLSETLDIAVKNTGTAPLTINWDAITITGVDAAAFSFDSLPSDSGTISVGNYSTLRIRYTPSTIGIQSAVISVLNNDLSRYSAVFTIKGTGYFPAPSSITASADSTDSITVSWSAVTGAGSYKVYRATSPDGTYTFIATSATTSYTNTGLSAGTAYYYKVSAVSTYGESVQSSYTTAKTKPETPTGVSAASLSASEIQITWNSVGGASSYKVYRATSSGGTYTSAGTSSTASYTNTGLNSNTVYYYKVSAYNDGGESVLSSETSATTKLTPPTGVSAVVSSSGIVVSWNSVTGATEYRIYRSTSSGGTYSQIGTTSSPATTYTNTGLTAGTRYYYRVSAYNNAGESTQSTTVYATTIPATPTGINATAAPLHNYINLSWISVTGAEGYRIYRSSAANGTYSLVASYSESYYQDQDSGLLSSTTYYYKVSAYNSTGESAQSAYVSATTAPAPPTVSVTATTRSSITISWTAVTGATGYGVYQNLGGTSYYHLGNTSSSERTITITGLNANTTYSFSVTYFTGAGESWWSTSVSGTTRP